MRTETGRGTSAAALPRRAGTPVSRAVAQRDSGRVAGRLIFTSGARRGPERTRKERAACANLFRGFGGLCARRRGNRGERLFAAGQRRDTGPLYRERGLSDFLHCGAHYGKSLSD